MSQQTWLRRLLGILMVVTLSGQFSTSVWCKARCLQAGSTKLAAARQTASVGCHGGTLFASRGEASARKIHVCLHGSLPSLAPSNAPFDIMLSFSPGLPEWLLESRTIAHPFPRRLDHAPPGPIAIHAGVLRV